MKFKTWTVGIAVLALATAPAFAEPGLGQWSYDQNVVPVGCDGCSSGCCGDDCCGCDCGDGCGCGSGVGAGGLLGGTFLGGLGAFSISDALGIEAFDIGGWTQIGYTSQPTLLSSVNPAGARAGGSFNNLEDMVNLHQQWFYIGREADGSDGIGFGFRADFMYGVDGTDTQAFGNPPGSFDYQNGFDHGIYSYAIPQLYGEVAIGDLSIIIGHFFTLVGYEVVPAPDNFFFSHSLTMYNSEPFTHTGVLATYSGLENVTLYSGWTLGWDTGFDNLNQGTNYIGGFGLNLTDAISLTWICTYGNFGAIGTGGGDDYGQSVVVDVSITDKLNYVFQTDYKKVHNTFDEDKGINQYLFYNWNDVLAFGTRIEWWRDDTTSYCEYTGGVNVKLLDNLVWRPEYRHDWVPETGFDQDIWACDVILTY